MKSNQTINEHKTNLGDHHWIESNKTKTKKPNAYVLLTYSGNHYRLISYKNKTMFKELPKIIQDKIKEQCSQNGVLKGTFGRLLN